MVHSTEDLKGELKGGNEH